MGKSPSKGLWKLMAAVTSPLPHTGNLTHTGLSFLTTTTTPPVSRSLPPLANSQDPCRGRGDQTIAQDTKGRGFLGASGIHSPERVLSGTMRRPSLPGHKARPPAGRERRINVTNNAGTHPRIPRA